MKVSINEICKIECINDLLIIQVYYNGCDIYPGQFFMIGPLSFENKDFILNRPFSVSNFSNNLLEFRIRIVGRFTKWLSQCNKGAKIRLVGPLGNYLTLENFKKFERIVLIGGGIGIAPMIFYTNFFALNKIKYIFSAGLPSKNELHYLKEVKNENIILYSEDGSYGKKGFCTEILENIDAHNTLVIACGPKAMYKSLKSYEDKFIIKVLLEEKMACGFGVCLGCVVKSKNGYKRVCVEGPMFDLKDIIFDEENTCA